MLRDKGRPIASLPPRLTKSHLRALTRAAMQPTLTNQDRRRLQDLHALLAWSHAYFAHPTSRFLPPPQPVSTRTLHAIRRAVQLYRQDRTSALAAHTLQVTKARIRQLLCLAVALHWMLPTELPHPPRPR